MKPTIAKVKSLIDIDAKKVIGISVSTGTHSFQSIIELNDFHIGDKVVFIPIGYKYEGLRVVEKQANTFKSQGLVISVPKIFSTLQLGCEVDLDLEVIDVEKKIKNAFDVDANLFDFMLNQNKGLYHQLNHKNSERIIVSIVYSNGKYKLIKSENNTLTDISSKITQYIPLISIDVFTSCGILTKDDAKDLYKIYPDKLFKKQFKLL